MFNPATLPMDGILIAAVVGFLIGGIWFSGFAFRDAWFEALESETQTLGNPGAAMLGNALTAVVTSGVLALLLQAMQVRSAWSGAGVGLLSSLGLVATSMLSDCLFSGSPMRLMAIQAGYRVVFFTAAGAIIGGAA